MKVKQLTLSAMISAIISVIIFIDSRFSYIFSSYLGFILPVPIVLLVINENAKVAIITSIATVLIMLISGSVISLIYIIPALFIGLITGWIINKNINVEKSFIYYLMLNLIFVLIQYYFLTYLLKIDADIMEELKYIIQQFDIQLSSFNIQFIVVMFILVLSLFQCVIMLLVVKLIQIRLLKKQIIYFNLTMLHFNRIFGIVSMIILGFYFVSDYFTASLIIQFLTASLIGVVVVLNIASGISVISYYLIKLNHTKLIGIVPILCIIPLVLMLVVVVGIVDSLYNIRRRII